MRKLLLCLCLVSLVLAGCSQPVQTQKGEQIFGEFAALDLAGTAVNQEIFADYDLTMVNIWGTYCSPCIEEMPALAALHGSFDGRVQVVGIVVDGVDQNGNPLPDIQAKAREIVARTGADYRHLLPSKSLKRAYLDRVEATPETIFVDANGYQVGERYLGAKTRAQWEAIIASLLESLP